MGFDVASAIGERRKGGGALVVIVVVVRARASIGGFLVGREAEGLDVSTGETNSDNRLGGVDGLAEELGGEGELAEVLVERHHGVGGPLDGDGGLDLGDSVELAGEVFCSWCWGRFLDLFGGRIGSHRFWVGEAGSWRNYFSLGVDDCLRNARRV